MAAARVKKGLQEKLYLGNLDSKRDWGYAKDYVEAMWLMLQQDTPENYVIATNETHTVREFVELTFKELNIDIIWQGKDENEIGLCKKTKSILVEVDPRYYRPTEVEILIGDYSKAKRKLGWEPKVKFKELVKIMINYDWDLLNK